LSAALLLLIVIPAQAGIQFLFGTSKMDPGLRRDGGACELFEESPVIMGAQPA